MRYLIFSDIHGNLDALERVAEEISILRPDITISLGDVVGYGANPNECIDMVENLAKIKIAGNHDLAVAGLIDTQNFNHIAREAIQWTRDELRTDYINILSEYDTVRRYRESLFVHASPISPLDWEYIYTVNQAKDIFTRYYEKFIFIGHTHVPAIISYGPDGLKVEENTRIKIDEYKRYLINVGSVGQPRDGIVAASFALLDEKKGIISIRRVPYDVRTAQEKIISVGLPETLAMRLASAR